MAAQKSIAKPAVAPTRAARANASTLPRARAGKPRSSRKRLTRERRSLPASRAPHTGRGPSPPAYDELLENLSRHLSLVETVSIALRTLEDRPDVGPICAALEQAVTMLGRAHEAVDEYLQGQRT